MHKSLVVAKNEFISAVSSKAFVLGLLMMPVFMGGAFAVQYFTRDQVDTTDRRVAIVDKSGVLYSVIAAQAEERNASIYKPDSEGEQKQVQPRFIIEEHESTTKDDSDAKIELSERVKNDELFAYLIIGSQIIESANGESPALAYHTQTPSYSELPNWLEGVVNAEIRRLRMEELQLDPAAVAAATSRVGIRRFGLVETDETGNAKDAKEENRIATFAVPFAGLMLMFMLVMTVAPTMLNNVLEEKMQKISEFLVSSVTPFQLLLGKLMAGVAVAMTLSFVYLAAAYSVLRYYEIQDLVPWVMYPWFVFFLLLALTIFGSIFSAVGAACTEIRDAQGLMTPVMLMVVIPMFCVGPILEAPNSAFSQMISLFPPATPMLMFVRIAIPPGPAGWEIVLACLLTLAFAVGCVWAGGKVFRIGILSQGQSANLRQLAQWVFSKQ